MLNFYLFGLKIMIDFLLILSVIVVREIFIIFYFCRKKNNNVLFFLVIIFKLVFDCMIVICYDFFYKIDEFFFMFDFCFDIEICCKFIWYFK